MTSFSESTVEQAALAWLESIGWPVRSGPQIAPGEPTAERDEYGQVVLERRLRDALGQLKAIQTVLEQAEVLSAEWAVE